MTEYTTSSDAIREYMSARERTAMWIQRHTNRGPDDVLLSPSAQPSIISDSDAPSYGPSDSDEGSDRSLPPRMVLRWNDGRPDVPISMAERQARARAHSNPVRNPSHGFNPRAASAHPSFHHPGQNYNGERVRDQSVAQNPSQRSRHAQTLSYASGPLPHQGIPAPPSPEHIVVLPSPQEEAPPAVSGVPSHSSHSSRQHFSHSHSRNPSTLSAQPEQIIPTGIAPSHRSSQHHSIHAPTPRRAVNHSSSHSQGTRFHENPPPPRPQTQLPYAYSPPQIIYAPSSRNPGTRYAPPQIVYSPPSRTRGPSPGPITYSHSDPLPLPHNQSHYRSPRGVLVENDDSSGYGSEDGHGVRRTRSLGRGQGHRARTRIDRSPSLELEETPPLSDAGSRTSGSTYYILPTPGQKVQVIVSLLHLAYSYLSLIVLCSRRQAPPLFRRIRTRRRCHTLRTQRTGTFSSACSTSRGSRVRSTQGGRRDPRGVSCSEGTPVQWEGRVCVRRNLHVSLHFLRPCRIVIFLWGFSLQIVK